MDALDGGDWHFGDDSSPSVGTTFFAGTTVKSNFIATLGYGDPSTIFGKLPRPGFDKFNTIL